MKRIAFIILFLAWFGQAEAVTQLKKTVKPSGGDYTSLEACMNANEQDLTAADKYFDVEIDGTWSSADTTAVTIHNYVTDATRYINIYTTVTARHNGKAAAVSGLSNYRLAASTGTYEITQSISFSTITGLEVICSGTTSGLFMGANSTYLIKNIIHEGKDVSAYLVETSNNAGTGYFLYNNIIYNATADFSRGISASGKTTVYNNTIYKIYRGIRDDGGNGTYKNNIIMGCTSVDVYNGSGMASATGTNNLTSDATGDDWGTQSNNLISKTTANQFVNITVTTEDLHLKAGADCIDAGVDLSTTFPDDIDGVTRSGTWDIGADEYVAATTSYGQVIIISDD